MSDIFKLYKTQGTNILDNVSNAPLDVPHPQSSAFILQKNTYTQHVYICELL